MPSLNPDRSPSSGPDRSPLFGPPPLTPLRVPAVRPSLGPGELYISLISYRNIQKSAPSDGIFPARKGLISCFYGLMVCRSARVFPGQGPPGCGRPVCLPPDGTFSLPSSGPSLGPGGAFSSLLRPSPPFFPLPAPAALLPSPGPGRPSSLSRPWPPFFPLPALAALLFARSFYTIRLIITVLYRNSAFFTGFAPSQPCGRRDSRRPPAPSKARPTPKRPWGLPGRNSPGWPGAQRSRRKCSASPGNS